MVCKIDYFQGYLYISFGSLWIAYLVLWSYNTWIRNSIHSKSIHKLIFFVLLFKSLNVAFTGFSQIFCESNNSEAYWGLGTTSTFTLYNTLLFTVVHLMSKGFCILRETLSRNEITSVAIVMGLVYLGFSAYLIEPTDVAPVVLIIEGGLFLSTVKSIIGNYKILQLRFYNLQQASILPLLPDLREKIGVMKLFLALVYLFYVNEIVRVALRCIGETLKYGSDEQFWVYANAAEVFFATFTCLSIFWIFRAKARRTEFNESLSVLHMPLPIARIFYADHRNENNLPSDDRPALVCFSLNLNEYLDGSEGDYMIALPLK